jgi:Tfp pilus assembly protein PilN
MADMELNFLRTRPPIPVLSWVLLGLGVTMAALAGNRYLKVSDDLAQAQVHGSGRHGQIIGRDKVARVSASTVPDNSLLTVPWGDLFARLEADRPANIAFLALDADGRKGTLTLTAEARKPADMIDYLAALRQKSGFHAVTLSGHTAMLEEDGRESLHFIVRMEWHP